MHIVLYVYVCTMERTELGKQLQDKRKSLGLSVYRIAQVSTLTRPQVDSIEKGTANYTIDSLIEYCNVTGIKLLILK